LKLGLSINDPEACQGYTLFCPMDSSKTFLIDMRGRVVHTWESECTPALCPYLMENGHLLRAGSIGQDSRLFGAHPGHGGRIQELAWTGGRYDNGKPIKEWEDLSTTIKSSGGKSLNLQIRRGGETVNLTVQPTKKEGRTIFGERKDDWIIGISSQVSIEKGNPGLAVVRAFYQTYDYAKLTLLALFKMISGDVSPRNIGGPILIAQMAGQQAQEGVGSFLAFLAVLSINLGVLNLLPVPVLDGGHLLFFLVEAVIRKPVALRYREMAQQVGICILALLMIYAFYNDIVRFFEKQVGG